MIAGGVSPWLMKQSTIILEYIYFYEVDFFQTYIKNILAMFIEGFTKLQ